LINLNLSNEDFKVLKQGPDLDILELQYVPIDDGIVDQLAEFPVWTEIWIYGTGMTREGFARAEKVLGDVALTYSRGAFLGVRCMQDSVRVDVVEQNSAAEECGIEKGDRLISVNDRPLKKFEDLRQELSNFAYGESVVIEFEKFQTQERIKKSVTLGRRK
jgi:S1-C subfamily serine protease